MSSRIRPIFLLSLFALACGRSAEPAPPAERATPAPSDRAPSDRAPSDPAPAAPSVPADSPLLHPENFAERAPDSYAVELTTSKGAVIIDVTREWAPIAADRFYNLVKSGYLSDVAFFRVIDGFMAQVGIHGDPRVNRVWERANLQDEPVVQHNTRGMVTFAKTGLPNSRANQFFINFSDNSRLDSMGFAPFGRVRDMTVVDTIHAGYGEGAPNGRGPAQQRISSEGNAYLRSHFPELDYIQSARVLE